MCSGEHSEGSDQRTSSEKQPLGRIFIVATVSQAKRRRRRIASVMDAQPTSADD
jgi:hypothetical protein